MDRLIVMILTGIALTIVGRILGSFGTYLFRNFFNKYHINPNFGCVPVGLLGIATFFIGINYDSKDRTVSTLAFIVMALCYLVILSFMFADKSALPKKSQKKQKKKNLALPPEEAKKVAEINKVIKSAASFQEKFSKYYDLHPEYQLSYFDKIKGMSLDERSRAIAEFEQTSNEGFELFFLLGNNLAKEYKTYEGAMGIAIIEALSRGLDFDVRRSHFLTMDEMEYRRKKKWD